MDAFLAYPRVSPRIVVVDDDPSVRDALKFALELEGYSVFTFESAESLLPASEADEADCLVLDYRLPGRNGIELLDSLRARSIFAPAILMTTQPDRSLRESAARVKAPIIEKPLLGEALSAAIRSALGAG